jgi:ABC-type transporter Mla maintaining outer membrane lipid asymmetry permease subunit MlaE
MRALCVILSSARNKFKKDLIMCIFLKVTYFDSGLFTSANVAEINDELYVHYFQQSTPEDDIAAFVMSSEEMAFAKQVHYEIDFN